MVREPESRAERAVKLITDHLFGYLDKYDSEELARDIVQILILGRMIDPIGAIREILEPKDGTPGIEFAGPRAGAAIACYRLWLESSRVG